MTYERDVLPEGHFPRRLAQREHRHSYKYPNGSEIVAYGQANENASTEYDIAYVQEATEPPKMSEMLTRPLRNGVIPYQQIMLTATRRSGRLAEAAL